MRRVFAELDALLRGEATRLRDLRDATIHVTLWRIALGAALLAAVHGVCMSAFTAINRPQDAGAALLATALKVPALFLLTVAVTFPSLYVFNALVGSRLLIPAVLRLIVAALGVTTAVLSSLGPIVAFFSFTTESYPFMVLLNVAVFAVAGILGAVFLLQTLHRLTWVMHGPPPAPAAEEGTAPPTTPDDPGEPLSALDPVADHLLGRHVRAVFRIWVIVFGLVGAQLGWVLRPFIGAPTAPFAWLRPRSSSFFEAVWRTIMDLLA
jgi:hypothetical protein